MCTVYKVAVVCLSLALVIGAVQMWWMCSTLVRTDSTKDEDKNNG